MEQLPVEIFDTILQYLTLSDWKCLRLTSRSIYRVLSSISSFSRHRPIVLKPQSVAGASLLENFFGPKDVDKLLLSDVELEKFQMLFQTSQTFGAFLKQLEGLSFAGSTRLIDSRLFYELLDYCESLEKLDLSNYKFFFLSHKFTKTSRKCPSLKRLNLNSNTHISDYSFNCLVEMFPNLTDLHLHEIPLRSLVPISENRTFLTFENVYSYIQNNYQRLEALTITFDQNLPCDAHLRRLFSEVPPSLNYLHVSGNLTTSTLMHLLLLFENRLKTLIVGALVLDQTGFQPLFGAISQFASNLNHLCIFLNSMNKFYVSQQQKPVLHGLNSTSEISLQALENLNVLDIQTVHSLSYVDLISLFNSNISLKHLKKLALPRQTTDEVIRIICTKSACAKSIRHLDLNNCPLISNRAIILINKYLTTLIDLSVNYNVNINDFAFIGISICGIGKAIEWLDHTLIEKNFIDDLSIWSCTVTHQATCLCDLPAFYSSSCVKLRLKDFNFDVDENSTRILSILTKHRLFDKYFYSINNIKSLKFLKLVQCVQLTNRLFLFGLRHLPDLKVLELNGCDKLDDQHLSMIGQNCPSIETIDLSGCNRITDSGRRDLRNHAKRLKNIEF